MDALSNDQVIYEDNHLLVVDKPAGIATMGEESGQQTVARLAANYIKHKYSKPGNVFVGVVSRLDKFVSGVLVLARTSKAASRLSDQIRRQTVRKFYLAWLADVPDGAIDGRSPDLAQGGKDLRSDAWHSLSHYVRKNDVAKRVECFEVDVPERARSGAKLAELRYRVLETGDQGALVEIELLTGRKHQIRAQFSHLGCPIVGDQKYDWDSRSGQKFEPYSIALHACRLEFEHPTRKEPLCFRSTPGEMWRGLPKEWRRRIND